jgi:predicted HAD superfamily Cof-like phosphohydrolase
MRKVNQDVIDTDIMLCGKCYIEKDEQGNERRIDPLKLIIHSDKRYEKKSALEMVEEFHQAFNCPVLKMPTFATFDRVLLREKLMREELQELREAMHEKNMVEILDGLCDLLYVVYGTAHEYGLGPVLKEAFREVHRSNMSKRGTDGKPIMREDGKVLKGPNFTPPDQAGIINQFESLASLHPDCPTPGGKEWDYKDFRETLDKAAAEGKADKITTPVMKAMDEFKEQINQATETGKTLTPDILKDNITSIDMNREERFHPLIDEIELIQTCGACPEQYDAFYNSIQVGYLRLRHGYFRVDYKDCGGETIYEAEPEGDGIFEDHERAQYLNAAKEAIMKRLKEDPSGPYAMGPGM